jgi:hypothetical protein
MVAVGHLEFDAVGVDACQLDGLDPDVVGLVSELLPKAAFHLAPHLPLFHTQTSPAAKYAANADLTCLIAAAWKPQR